MLNSHQFEGEGDGSGEFVKTIVGEVDERLKRMVPLDDRLKQARAYIEKTCETEGLDLVELKSGSRRQPVSRARAQISVRLVKTIGLTMAETARQLGVTTAAVARILERAEESEKPSLETDTT